MNAPLPTQNVEELKRLAIKEALAFCEGNILAASKATGLSVSTIYRWLHDAEILRVLQDSQIEAPQTVVV